MFWVACFFAGVALFLVKRVVGRILERRRRRLELLKDFQDQWMRVIGTGDGESSFLGDRLTPTCWPFPVISIDNPVVSTEWMTGYVRTDGVKEWYLDGKLHREDGPAIEYPDGSKEWFLNGIRTKAVWATENLSWREKRDAKEARREEFEDEDPFWD